MMPRMNLLVLMGLAGIPLILGIWYPILGQISVLLTLLLLVVSLVDLAISPTPARVDVWREVGDVMSLGARNPVKIWLRNQNRLPLAVEVHDEPPLPATMEGLPFRTTLQPGRNRFVVYHTRPHQRGKNTFGRLDLRARSRLSLWTLYDERLLKFPVRIYPDIQAVFGVELLARQNRLAEAGVKLSRLQGRGSEFDRLREYRREDEYRNIDWKATARFESLISREYVVERNQNILFLLDCGRSMCNELNGITHFDRALNSVMLLSYVALRQGDTVGILACSNRVQQWVPPMRGSAAVRTLIRQTYLLEPSYEASDYGLMVEQLRHRYRKRSLVILVTHALDEVHLGAISRHMRELQNPHLVLAAFLRNVPLHQRVNALPTTDLESFQIAAAARLVATQTAQIVKLEKSGLLAVETVPEQMSAQLISRYLDIKARHLL